MEKGPQQTSLGTNVRKLMEQDACFVMRAPVKPSRIPYL